MSLSRYRILTVPFSTLKPLICWTMNFFLYPMELCPVAIFDPIDANEDLMVEA